MTETTSQETANVDATSQDVDTSEQKAEEAKTFTQEDFNKTLGEALKEKEAKLEKRMAEKLKQELDDRERQSKLTAEQRAEEERKKLHDELSEKERNLALRENRADARELLIERGIDSTLVDFVVDVDADKTKENVNQLEKAYVQAVKAGVDKALAGTTPKDPTSEQRVETQQYGNTTVI